MRKDNLPNTCTWIGEGEYCYQTVISGKSYCKKHYDRIYLKLFSEMADFILEKELDGSRSNLSEDI